MNRSDVARSVHLTTFVVAVVALVLQLAVILSGQTILDNDVITAPLPEQVRRYFSFFTIQSNLLVAVSTYLVVSGRTGTAAFRVLRLASLIGITVTGVVAAVALPPSSGYTAVNLLCDRLLHIVVPVLAFAGWVLFGPRGHAGRRDILPALAWPVGWLVATLALAPLTHWYPYPFLDVDRHGLGPVLLACLVIAALFVGLAFLATWADRRLDTTRGSDRTG